MKQSEQVVTGVRKGKAPEKAAKGILTAAERTSQRGKLRGKGIPQAIVDSIVAEGKTNAEIVQAMIAYCRGLKKK